MSGPLLGQRPSLKTTWRSVERIADVPRAPGCYAVYHDGELVYVGSSVKLQSRLASYFGPSNPKRPRRRHINSGARPRHDGVAVTVKVAGSRRIGDWLMREYRLIQRLKPRDNRVGTGQYAMRRSSGVGS